jgi:F-type H+-transporting ATPase subunit b
MRRPTLAASFLLALVLAAPTGRLFAQEPEKKEGHAATQEAAHDEEGGLEIWKWANFVLLAAGLGYLIGKNAGPFFASRSAAIRKDLEESLRQRSEAEARAADVDRRLAALDSDIAALRVESQRELAVGEERMTRQSAEYMAKIQAQAEQEIASAGKYARADLKRYAAELAIGLAEQKIRARMTDSSQDAMVESFVRDLK